VTLKAPSDEYRVETNDISAGGILFRAETVEVGSTVEFAIAMPGDVLGTDPDVLVKYQGRIVPFIAAPSGHTVAVVIDDYKFERV
jgi:hypothetical protein